MMSNTDKILEEALALGTIEKLELMDKLLLSFYPISQGVEALWKEEAQERLSSYEKGNIPIIDEENTFSKYKR